MGSWAQGDARQLRLPDGRAFAYCIYGPGDGQPVVFSYGTPGTMFLAPDRLSPLDEAGVRLGGRVTRCASAVGLAPPGADGLDWLAGMSPANAEEFTRARSGEDAYRPLVAQLARDGGSHPAAPEAGALVSLGAATP